jgi:2-phospho-L-lactate guanylyltransferase
LTCWVVIPVKAPDACKTRLSGVLDEAARRALVARMLHHVVDVASGVAAVDEVLLLGPSRHGLPESVRLLADPGGGLNAALGAAAQIAAVEGVDRLVFVSADLPLVTPADIATLAGVAPGVMAIAPDRGGTGTNALSLPGETAARFPPHFGIGSFAAHGAEARRLGLDVHEIRSATLALDIDLPADLDALAAQAADWSL